MLEILIIAVVVLGIAVYMNSKKPKSFFKKGGMSQSEPYSGSDRKDEAIKEYNKKKKN